MVGASRRGVAIYGRRRGVRASARLRGAVSHARRSVVDMGTGVCEVHEEGCGGTSDGTSEGGVISDGTSEGGVISDGTSAEVRDESSDEGALPPSAGPNRSPGLPD